MARELHILVVDDEQIVLDSVQKLLRKDDYVVHGALSAKDALAVFKAEPVDIVLTDLMMPDIDGLELMKLLKADNPGLPVIMITGYATINTALQATQLGAFDYIAKPFSRKELQSVVGRAAELLLAVEAEPGGTGSGESTTPGARPRSEMFKSVGDHSWIMMEEEGIVLLGVEHSYVSTIGKIQTISLPAKGDEVRQGGVYLQIFSSDLRSHTVLSPLSGIVVDVNEKVLTDPESILQDPYGEGWLIRMKPSRFDAEIKTLGL